MRKTIYAVLAVAVAACGGTKNKGASAPAAPVATAPPVAAVEPATPVETAPVPAVGHPSNDLIPRATFLGNPSRVAVRVSPDGKYMSWLAPKDDVLNVWIAPAGKLDEAKAVTDDQTRPVREYFWAFDKRHLLYLQDKAGNENFHVFSVDVAKGGPAVDLTPLDKVRAMVLGTSPTKPNTILVGLNDRDPKLFDVYAIDLKSGQRTMVEENPKYAGFVIDHDLKVRFGVETTPDGGQLVTELAPAKGKQPVTIEIPAADSMTTDVHGFDRRGRTLYMMDSRGRNTGGLFTYDLRTGKEKLVAEDPRSDVANVMIHPTRYTLEAVQFDYEKATWKVLDKKVQRDFDAFREMALGDFDVVSRTLDDRTWIVAFHSDVQPASYYRWDRRTRKATHLFDARPELEKVKLARMTPEIIKSRDGLDLVSYLTLPVKTDPNSTGKPSGATPMVLFVHGGPWYRDHWGYDPWTQLLANRGYAVLQVNYRGSTGFGKKFVNAGNHEWSGKMHTDLLDAVDWAVAQGIAPKDKICIMGGSYGGYATLVGVTMTPDVFACGVDLVGPSNLLTLVKTIPPYWNPMIAMFKDRLGNWDTDAGKQALMAASPINHVDAIKAPLLIAQGANDPRVNQAESDQIVKAMQDKRIPVTYVLFSDEGHGFARPENNLAFFAVAEAFLSAHLGGLYQPAAADDFKGSTMKVIAGKEGIPGLPDL